MIAAFLLAACGGPPAAADPPVTTTTATPATSASCGDDDSSAIRYPAPRHDTIFVPRNADHEAAGIEAATEVGEDATGLILGMSNTSSVAERFIADWSPIPFVNAAIGGADARKWATGNLWPRVRESIESAGVQPDEIEVVWMLHSFQGTANPEVQQFCIALQDIIEQVIEEFPSIRMIYVSDRGWGGWSTGLATDGTPNNGEPGVWAQAVGIDHLVATNRDRADKVWVGWGPYVWANGDEPRADGVSWPRSYFQTDGVHWRREGRVAYAELLDQFFSTDETAGWYRLEGDSGDKDQ